MKKKIINFGLVLILLLPLIVFASGFKIQNENYRANYTDTWERIKKRGTLLIGVDDTFVPMDFRKKNPSLQLGKAQKSQVMMCFISHSSGKLKDPANILVLKPVHDLFSFV